MSESIPAMRSLLRAIRQRFGPKAQNSMWHNYVVAEYRRHAGETDPSKLQQLSQLVEDYTDLVHDVHHERVSCLQHYTLNHTHACDAQLDVACMDVQTLSTLDTGQVCMSLCWCCG